MKYILIYFNYEDNNYYDNDNNNQNGCSDSADIENDTNEYDSNDNGKTTITIIVTTKR